MVEHMVMIKFGEQTTKEQKDEVVSRARNLQNLIPGIIDLKVGHNFSTRSQGYDIGLTVRFERRDQLEAYGPHPEHQKLVAYMNEVGAHPPLVVDFETE